MIEQSEAQVTTRVPAHIAGLNVIRGVARTSWTFSRRHPLGGISGIIVLLVVAMAVGAPLWEDLLNHQTKGNPTHLFVDPDNFKKAPNSTYILGTDYAGRDILSRIIYGARISLSVSILAVLFGTLLGSVWGVATAYIGGRFDMYSQRVLEVNMAFPAIILAMILVTALGAGFWVVVFAIAATRISYSTRVIRSVSLAVKEFDYVLAARAIGASNIRVMVRHIAPQCAAAFLILATAHMGVAIIIEASLGFLGAGINEPTPTWGNMIGPATRGELIPHWPVVVWPGLIITLTVLCFNLFGDSLRDALDPKLRGRGA